MIAHRGEPAHDGGGEADPDVEQRYALAEPKVGERAFEVLHAALRMRVTASARVSRTYYDTFDRRLAAAGSLLVHARGDGEPVLRWESIDGRLERRLPTSGKPGLATDLPAGPFRDALEARIDVRRVLPLTELRGTARTANVLDTRGKTTVRVSLENWRLAGNGTQKKLTLLRIAPVKGYAREAMKIAALLREELGLTPMSADAHQAMLGLATPRKSSSGPRLRAGMRSDEAAKRVYSHLLDVIVANEEGTRARTDPEFLHQYRVAIRRTRAGLARLKGIFPVRTVERFKREFRWLGSVTSPMRDLDVHLLELPAYAEALPPETHEDLEPLREHLEAEADAEQKRIVKALGSARYRKLIADWREFLERPPALRTSLPDAARPVEELARARIWKLHKRILKRGAAIDDDTPAEAVHDLRLDCKKLRYLMEFFRELFPAEAMQQQIKALKRLQDVLGRFNDFEVQQGALQDAAESMAEHDSAPLPTIVVMGRLIETSRRRQDEARAEICGRIAAFGAPENRARAKQLFAAGPEVRNA